MDDYRRPSLNLLFLPAFLFLALASTVCAQQFGKIVGWGKNFNGQTTPLTYFPPTIVEIAAGDNYNLVRGTDGSVVGWGDNFSGQSSPPSMSNVVALAAGSSHALALINDGSVIGWGNNFDGQAAPPLLTTAQQITAGDDFSLALLTGGSVTGWGNNVSGQVTPPAFTAVVTAITAGKTHALALLNNGTVVGWGDDTYLQLTPPPAATSVVQIAAGRNFSVALRANGSLIAWGDNTSGQTIVPPLFNIAEVAAGGSHGVALKTDGTVVCWGDNTYGQTNTPPGLSNVVAISAGENHTLVQRNDGSLVGWGNNAAGAGEAPHVVGPSVVAISAGGGFALAVKIDGQIVGWGGDSDNEASPPFTTNIASFSAGHNHGLAVTSNRVDFGWGNASNGKSTPPVFLTNVVKVSAGRDHSLVLNGDGSVYAFGDDTFGQVSNLPTMTNATAIAAGGFFNLALRADNTVTGWGQGFAGQLTPPAGLGNVIAIDAGERHSMALKSDGSVTSWGDNAYGQMNMPAGLTNVIAISAGQQHSVVLLDNHKVVAWGDGAYGATNVPTSLSNVFAIAAGDGFTLALQAYPAEISQQPNSTNVSSGSSASFTIGTLGSPPFTFQWRLNGTNISGANAQTYFISSAAGPDAGAYDVILSNFCGAVTSATATLGVGGGGTPPVIVAQPADLNLYSGSIATFISGATGSPPIQFRWRHSGTNIAGATATNFQIASVAPGDAGQYVMLASNAFGVATSAPAILVVDDPAHIVKQPTNVTVGLGGGADFSVTAIGSGFLYHQWRKDGTQLVGQVSSNLNFTGTVAGDAGNYDVIVSNNLASVTSAVVTLTILSSPVISADPTNATVVAGSPVAFSVTANGSGPLKYQWRFNNGIIGGETSATYTIAAALPGNAGSYDVIVSNTLGSVTSAAATLVVNVKPVVVQNPAGQTVIAGSPVNFYVGATGTTPIAYQWRKNGTPIGGATATNLFISSATPGDAGTYDALASNVAGVVTSAPAVLTVQVAPVVTVGPTGNTVIVGNSAVFNVTATGTLPFAYQWRHGGTPIGGATTSFYVIASTVPGDQGNYDVVITNVAGAATSTVATLNVLVPPNITSNPANQSIVVGGSVSFGVAATGSSPMAFQWRKNGTNIAGSVSATHPIGSVAPSDAGQYVAIVSNAAGVVTSSPALLTVLQPPNITAGPTNLVVNNGNPARFDVTATGTAPITYQWRRNATNIAGATGTNYLIASASLADIANYDVLVSNVVGVITSAMASLNVLDTPVIVTQPSNTSSPLGGSASFNVAATSSLVLAYQWRHGGTIIANATGTTYTVPVVNAVGGGVYDVVVTNSAGAVTSATATLTIQSAITINRQPGDAGAWRKGRANFEVDATGSAPLQYQWYYNGTVIPTATNAGLPLFNADFAMTGTYSVVVSNAFGSITSRNARLRVISTTAGGARNDFDGDGQTDVGVYVPVAGSQQITVWLGTRFVTLPSRMTTTYRGWRLRQSTVGFAKVDFGTLSDVGATGDFDDDGKTDLAVYRPRTATFYVLRSSDGQTESTLWGPRGSRPVVGDYDGDGVSDYAVFHPRSGDWHIERSSDGEEVQFNWGSEESLPVPGDYDGDAVTDIAVFDPATGDWFIQLSSDGSTRVQNWGWAGAVPLRGDYDGDGITDLAVYNPADSTWYVLQSSDGEMRQRQFGWNETVPVPGDYDGDTLTDLVAYHQAMGDWYIMTSSEGELMGGGPVQFGWSEALPIMPW